MQFPKAIQKFFQFNDQAQGKMQPAKTFQRFGMQNIPDYRFTPDDLWRASQDSIASQCVNLVTRSIIGAGWLIKCKDEKYQPVIDKFLKNVEFDQKNEFIINSLLGTGGDVVAFFIKKDEQIILCLESVFWSKYRRILFDYDDRIKQLTGSVTIIDQTQKPLNKIEVDQITFIHSQNLTNDFLGITPLMSITHRVLEKLTMVEMNRDAAQRGGRLKGIFSISKDLIKSATADDRIDDMLSMDNFMTVLSERPAKNNYQEYAISPISLDFIPLQMDNRQMEYTQIIRSINYEICSAFGVPSSLINFDESTDPNLSNAEQYTDNFAKLNLNYLKDKLERFWREIFERSFPNIECEIFIAREQTDETITLRNQLIESVKLCKDLKDIGISAKPDPELLKKLGIITKETEEDTTEDYQNLSLSESIDIETKAISQILQWNGLELGIDYQPGQDRFGFGKPLKCRYGHIRNYVGLNNMALNCYIGNYLNSQTFWKIQQLDVDGEIDEYKIMIGFQNKDQAVKMYLQQIPKKFYGGIEICTLMELNQWKKKLKSSSDQNEIDDTFTKYHNTVNMGYNELLNWSKNPKSKLASLSPEPLTRNLRLLNKHKDEWTISDIRGARKTIAYIARAKTMGKGEVTDETKPFGRNEIALRNWAYSLSTKAITKVDHKAPNIEEFLETKEYKDFKKKLQPFLSKQLEIFEKKFQANEVSKALVNPLLEAQLKSYFPSSPVVGLTADNLLEIIKDNLMPEIIRQYNEYYDDNADINNLPRDLENILIELAQISINGNGADYLGIDNTTFTTVVTAYTQILTDQDLTLDTYSNITDKDLKRALWLEMRANGQKLVNESRLDILSQMMSEQVFNHAMEVLNNVQGNTFVGVYTMRDKKVRPSHQLNEGNYFPTDELIDESHPWLDEGCRCRYVFGTEQSLINQGFTRRIFR